MNKPGKNIFYAQSGGVTAVINASACGVIETARNYPEQFGKIYVGKNGILGALHEELIDTSLETPEAIRGLYHTPGGAFGSCRFKLKDPEQNRAEYERLLAIFEAYEIGTFFYNGGGDSQDTANKVAAFSQAHGLNIRCIGIPKHCCIYS
jgi:ATP-dependent phosphofructokinase / diphosphate-dependent phosphofructokinase